LRYFFWAGLACLLFNNNKTIIQAEGNADPHLYSRGRFSNKPFIYNFRRMGGINKCDEL